MKDRHEWTILFAVVLAIVAGTDLHAQVNDFWQHPELWRPPMAGRAALVSTAGSKSWNVTVRVDETSAWQDAGKLKEITRRPFNMSLLPPEQQNLVDNLGTSLVVGETKEGKRRLYVMAVVFGSGNDDLPVPYADGSSSYPLIPLFASTDYDAILDLAERYIGVLDETGKHLPKLNAPAAPPSSTQDSESGGDAQLAPKCPCDESCDTEWETDRHFCDGVFTACLVAADANYLRCVRMAPEAQMACSIQLVAANLLCIGNAVLCNRSADQTRRQCYINCELLGGGPPAGGAATQVAPGER